LAQTLLIRDAWFIQNNREEDGRQIAELQYLNEPLDSLDLSQLRKAARDLGISFNPEDAENLERLSAILNLENFDKERLVSVLKAGIPHQVLNARKHTEESQIIARAGAFGAVTIATNMAGRGVDIKLGGELAEEVLTGVNRILSRAGYDDPYDMTLEERRQALLKLSPSDYGIYEAEVGFFLQYIKDMESVRALGGLHVIGSERHEARRIDNQLRGRSARQGDPGSSRFYLSMEDNLMRLFGGQQADGLMQRLKIDDAMPLEVGIVGRIVEQSQTRVEGANFDVRKHLLDYDDVLNTQRAKIYAQRNRIFTKEDLSEDVAEMLHTEVSRRVPEALQDEEGPWKLLAWLEQIQPPLQTNNIIFPSYTLKLLLEQIAGQRPSLNTQDAINALVDLAKKSIDAEEYHILHTVTTLLDQTQDRLKSQIDERMDTVDTFFEGLSMRDETETPSHRQLADELISVARLPIKLAPEQLRELRDGNKNTIDDVKDSVNEQVEEILTTQAITRLAGSIERRLEEPLDLNTSEVPANDWGLLGDQILDSIQRVFNRRRERFVGSEGQIVSDLETALAKANGFLPQNDLLQLMMFIPQGARATFDKRTHRRVFTRTTRLSYIYYAAQLLERRQPEEITEDVLAHLEEAQSIMQRAWGAAEWSRIANSPISDLDETTQNGLRLALGDEPSNQAYAEPLFKLSGDQRNLAVDELGRQAITEIYRQLLLQVITELWVDYLTQMEALRVSVGLEAYAQRDPLVQYKNRAFELFQNLLRDMRLGVVTRMFIYRPRDMGSVQTIVKKSETPEPEEVAVVTEAQASGQEITVSEDLSSRNKKRRRRRH
jgi:preprotein translocase subunit SecA